MRNQFAILCVLIILSGAVQTAEIHDAAKLGGCAKVQKLLSGDPKLVSLQDEQGLTPLHYAAKKGWKPVTELLIKSGADVEAKDKSGVTALDYAKAAKHTAVADLLRKEMALLAEPVKWSEPQPYGEHEVKTAWVWPSEGMTCEPADGSPVKTFEKGWLVVLEVPLKADLARLKETWRGSRFIDEAGKEHLPLEICITKDETAQGFGVRYDCPQETLPARLRWPTLKPFALKK